MAQETKPTGPTPSKKTQVKRAKVGMDNDTLNIHIAAGDVVPQELIDHSPWLDDEKYVEEA